MSLITALFLNKSFSEATFNINLIKNFYKSNSHIENLIETDSDNTFVNLKNLFITNSLKLSNANSSNLISKNNICVITNGSVFNDNHFIEKLTYYKTKKSTKTAEIILEGYLNKGINVFKNLNGPLVSILFDKEKERIIVTRDRFGSNLLFMANGPWGLALSSEIKALLNLTYLEKKPNWETIEKYLFNNYRYAFGSNNTFFKNIKLINPNTINIFNLKGKLLDELVLYESRSEIVKNISDKEASELFLNLMDKSLQKRLEGIEDEPAFLLSGGLDSPTIAALASNSNTKKIVTYSICYGNENIPKNELSYDERFLIKKIVDNNKIEWRPIYVKPNNFEEIYNEMLKKHDEPIASPTWYSHWLLMEKISNDGHKTIFGGDGGDHALAGLYDDIPYYFADLKYEKKYELLEREIDLWIKFHDHPIYKKNNLIWEEYCNNCFDWSNRGKITNYTWDEGQFRDDFSYKKIAENNFIKKNRNFQLFPSIKNTYLLSKLHQDLLYTSSPPSTRAEAANCSKFNIDLRSVFLDYEVINFCWSLPQNLMIRDGYTKYLIRISMNKFLPQDVVWNKKHVGLNSPANVWFRNELKDLMEESIKWEGWYDLKIFKQNRLESIWQDHLSLKNDHMMFFWKLYSLKKWLEKII